MYFMKVLSAIGAYLMCGVIVFFSNESQKGEGKGEGCVQYSASIR